jgi:hypothetical protein
MKLEMLIFTNEGKEKLEITLEARESTKTNAEYGDRTLGIKTRFNRYATLASLFMTLRSRL